MRKIIRSNKWGQMTLHTNGTYSVFSLSSQSYVYRSASLDATRSFWNRNYATSRQFTTPNGVNHCYL
jgi:hypothetical protein